MHIIVESGEVKNSRLKRLKEICRSFPPETYKSIDNNRLAVYAIALLSENNLQVTQEAVTVALYLLFPEKFSLVGFKEYPDAERVNRTLLQLGSKYRNWAIGNKQVGYLLNENGKLVLEQTKKLLESPESIRQIRKKAPKQRTMDPDIQLKEIEGTALFKAYKNGKRNNLSEFAIWELLRAFPYTPKSALVERLKLMTESAKLSGHDDVLEFLKWVKTKFSDVFKEERRQKR